MEKNMMVNGRELNFASTYDGDAQYNVQVRSGEKVLAMFKVSAESENEVFPAALAYVQSYIEMGNLKI